MSGIGIKTLGKGPLLVTDTVTLTDTDGGVYANELDTIALCRSGHSADKPFRDGSHKAQAFDDCGRVSAEFVTTARCRQVRWPI
jgi:CDGSH-type Zn-finger protein